MRRGARVRGQVRRQTWEAGAAGAGQTFRMHVVLTDRPHCVQDTLVAFVTEFGRMPTFQKGANGRDHNPKGFTVWLAGAGVKKAFSYGATDEFGYKAAERVSTIYDLHATILHLLGLEHEKLTFKFQGRDFRLTDVHGKVLHKLLA